MRSFHKKREMSDESSPPSVLPCVYDKLDLAEWFGTGDSVLVYPLKEMFKLLSLKPSNKKMKIDVGLDASWRAVEKFILCCQEAGIAQSRFERALKLKCLEYTDKRSDTGYQEKVTKGLEKLASLILYRET